MRYPESLYINNNQWRNFVNSNYTEEMLFLTTLVLLFIFKLRFPTGTPVTTTIFMTEVIYELANQRGLSDSIIDFTVLSKPVGA